MRKFAFLWLVGLVAVATGACGSSPPAASGVTPSQADVSTIALQPADLARMAEIPSSIQPCAATGTVDHWLEVIKTLDPAEYAGIKADWDRAQAAGAIASWTTVYSDSQASCADLVKTGSSENYSEYPFVVSTVIQFNSEKAATNVFKAGPFMHMDKTVLGSQPIPYSMVGSGTGLSDNSVSFAKYMIPPAGQPGFIYEAYWQCKSYVAMVVTWGLGGHVGPLLAVAVNARMT